MLHPLSALQKTIFRLSSHQRLVGTLPGNPIHTHCLIQSASKHSVIGPYTLITTTIIILIINPRLPLMLGHFPGPASSHMGYMGAAVWTEQKQGKLELPAHQGRHSS